MKLTKKELERLDGYIFRLNASVGLKKETMKDVQARLVEEYKKL